MIFGNGLLSEGFSKLCASIQRLLKMKKVNLFLLNVYGLQWKSHRSWSYEGFGLLGPMLEETIGPLEKIEICECIKNIVFGEVAHPRTSWRGVVGCTDKKDSLYHRFVACNATR